MSLLPVSTPREAVVLSWRLVRSHPRPLVLCSLAFVVAVVRARLVQLDPSVEEASQDLGAGFVGTLARVTLPAIAPAVLAGALLTFTLSLDEFVIAFFTNGPTTPTLPIAIYSRVRFGVTPEINALATVLMTASIVVVVFAAWVLRGAAAREQRGAVDEV